MERLGLPYVRYMDDWVILARTRWALRRVVQQVNALLDHLNWRNTPTRRSWSNRPRVRLPGIPVCGGRLAPGRPDEAAVCRASDPALRARCGGRPHRGVRSALVDMGPIGWPGTCLGRVSGWCIAWLRYWERPLPRATPPKRSRTPLLGPRGNRKLPALPGLPARIGMSRLGFSGMEGVC